MTFVVQFITFAVEETCLTSRTTDGQNARSEESMKRTLLGLLSLAVMFPTFAVAQNASAAAAPSTRAGDVQETLHGVTVPDPYRWLEDQESPDTRAWISQQNDYTHKLLDNWPGRDRLEKSLGELKKVERISSPIERITKSGRYCG